MSLLFNIKHTIFIHAMILAVINITAINQVHAGTIIVNENLDFGKFVLTNNNAPRSFNILPNGGYNADPQYVFFTPPQKGLVTVTDFSPLATLDVTISLANLNQAGISNNFSISDTYTTPLTVITDNTGSATFEVGAKLTSDGTGNTHSQGIYNGTLTVNVIEE